jgi:putative intracellular protease/amidase
VAGGPGWIDQTRSPETLAFIRRHAAAIPIVSVCTGGLILAASGVLDGKSATTKREVVPPEISPLERLRIDYPDIETCEASLVDEEASSPGVEYRSALIPSSTCSRSCLVQQWQPRRPELSNIKGPGQQI